MEEVVLQLARAAPTRAVVEQLASRPDAESLPGLAEEALSAGEFRAAVNLMLAGATAGHPPTGDLACQLLPVIEDTDIAIHLLGSVKDGLLDGLLGNAGSGRNTPPRQGLVLLLAAVVAGDEDPPDELLRRIRLFAREELEFESKMLAGLAALEVDDADVREVARSCVRVADNAAGRRIRKDILRRFSLPVLDAIPEAAPTERFAGFTVRKTRPDVGRNDPCSCGSGRKYKKCCLSKEDHRDELPDGSVPWGDRARLHASMSDEQFEALHPLELARIEPDELPTHRLVHAAGALAGYRLFPEAERRLEALAAREDLPEGTTLDSIRSTLVFHAMADKDRGAVERILACVDDSAEIQVAADIGLAILARYPDALERIEEGALDGLREPEGEGLFRLCAALLYFAPALGVFVTRGALDARRPEQAEELLAGIEKARDLLLLPPNDVAWEMYEALANRLVEEQVESAAVQRSEELAAEAQELRGAAAEARGREIAARRKLGQLEVELAETEQTVEESRAEAEEARRTEGPSRETVERLKQKVADRHDIIEELKAERRRLRRELAQFQLLLDKSAAADHKPESEYETDGLEEDDDSGPERRHVRLPVFAREFRDALGSVPEFVARDAVATAGALASGSAASWAAVKKLKAHEDLRSARIGTYRILFRLAGDDEIDFQHLVHRRELVGTLRRLG